MYFRDTMICRSRLIRINFNYSVAIHATFETKIIKSGCLQAQQLSQTHLLLLVLREQVDLMQFQFSLQGLKPPQLGRLVPRSTHGREERTLQNIRRADSDLLKTLLSLLIFILIGVKIRGKVFFPSCFSQLLFHCFVFLVIFKNQFCTFSKHPQQPHPASFQGHQSSSFIPSDQHCQQLEQLPLLCLVSLLGLASLQDGRTS